jgi:hypothetical protein
LYQWSKSRFGGVGSDLKEANWEVEGVDFRARVFAHTLLIAAKWREMTLFQSFAQMFAKNYAAFPTKID